MSDEVTDPQPNIDPAIAALLADITQFRPRCIVCTKEVPGRRATSRSKDTCSKECAKVLKLFRKHNIVSRFCRSCMHPSTPEERASWKAWRKATGNLRQGPGRPSARIGDLQAALQICVEALQALNRWRQADSSMGDMYHIVLQNEPQVTVGDMIDRALLAAVNVPGTKTKGKAPADPA